MLQRCRSESAVGCIVIAETRDKMRKKDDTTIRCGTANVFADLGFPNADTHLLKAQLMSRV
jgi:hypothetical protein